MSTDTPRRRARVTISLATRFAQVWALDARTADDDRLYHIVLPPKGERPTGVSLREWFGQGETICGLRRDNTVALDTEDADEEESGWDNIEDISLVRLHDLCPRCLVRRPDQGFAADEAADNGWHDAYDDAVVGAADDTGEES